jgi:hypothetical protein
MGPLRTLESCSKKMHQNDKAMQDEITIILKLKIVCEEATKIITQLISFEPSFKLTISLVRQQNTVISITEKQGNNRIT